MLYEWILLFIEMVLDIIMDPGMNGLDIHKKVIGICPKQKGIIVSGFSAMHL